MTAQAFFELSDRYRAAAHQMEDLIAEACGFRWSDEVTPAEGVSFDSYDYSFELHAVRNDFRLSAGQCAVLRALGFVRVWLNHNDKTETFYGLSGKLLCVSRKDIGGNVYYGQSEYLDWPEKTQSA